MIKTGILGADSDSAGDLIRLLLRHPDVDLRWASTSSPENAGLPLSEIHPLLIGETGMQLVSFPALNAIDCLFLCASPRETNDFMVSATALPADLRIVDLSGNFRDPEATGAEFVYALPELNRKSLVRGARRASLPSVQALAVVLPLLPMAKNLLVNAPVSATVIASAASLPETQRACAVGDLFEMPASPAAEKEIAAALASLQKSFSQSVELTTVIAPQSRGLISVVKLRSTVTIEQLLPLYEEYFSDHSFVTVTSGTPPTLRSVVTTNKAVVNLRKDTPDTVTLTTILDDRLKAGAATAIHALNLLFGLSEKTGLE